MVGVEILSQVRDARDMLDDFDVIAWTDFNVDVAFLLEGSLGDEDLAGLETRVW